MKIGIIGCSGRMGRMLVQEVLAAEGCELAGGTERPGSDAVGRDIGELIGQGSLGLTVVDEPERLFEVSQAVIDFSVPAASARHAALAAGCGCGLVIGTTGLDAKHEAAILAASDRIPIVKAGNMSLGVNLLLAVVEQVARALGPSFDVEIVEMHHRHKVDAPSGTALMLGRAAAAGHSADLDAVARRARDGITGARPKGEIGFATLRGGDVVGDHTVIFAGEGERLEIGHKASSRVVFAKGAVRAALWLNHRQPGLYAMRDVLGL